MEEEEEEKAGPEELTCPEWMMTMGDCMSLLLTFFVLLLTFSTTSQSRLMDVVGVMKGAFSFIETTNLLNREESAYNDNNSVPEEDEKVTKSKDASSIRLSSNSIQKKFKDMKESLSDVGFKYPLQIKKLDQGISIEVSIEDIFVGDTKTLTFNGKKLAQEVANVAYNIDNEMRIVTFLNPEDMAGSKLGDVWVTAMERNMKLSDVLNDKFGIQKSRFSIGTTVLSDKQMTEMGKSYSRVKVIFMEALNVKKVSIRELLKSAPEEI